MRKPFKPLLALVLIIASICCFGKKHDAGEAVTLVSYEQGWLDREGTLALKNNTNRDIRNVSFRIIYTDMKGNQLDYEDYDIDVDIAPGMVRKVNIPAYEHGRFYSYYQSEACYSNPHKFKVRFGLKSYNNPDDANDSGNSVHYDSSINYWIVLIPIIIMLLGFGIYIALYVVVGMMAKKRQRSIPLWIIVSLLATPLLAIILLLCFGNADDYEEENDFE